MDREHLHQTAVELHGLLEEINLLLKRSGSPSNLNPVEQIGYARLMDRLQALGNDLAKLAEEH